MLAYMNIVTLVELITSPDVLFFSWLAPRLVKLTDDIFLVYFWSFCVKKLPVFLQRFLTLSCLYTTSINSRLLYTHAHLRKT